MAKKGKKLALPTEPPPGMDEDNGVHVGSRVAVRGVRSPIMIIVGARQEMIRTMWFADDLTLHEGVFSPKVLVIVPDDKPPEQPTPEATPTAAPAADSKDTDQ